MKLREYWPTFMADLNEFDEIARLEQPLFDEIALAIGEMPKEFFFESLSEYGVSRWERIFGIIPEANETLAARRETIKVRMLEQLPFTIRLLRQQLVEMCGHGNYYLCLDNDTYQLRVAVVSRALEAAELLLSRIVPANLEITLSTKYNRYGQWMDKKMTYDEMFGYTCEELRSGFYKWPEDTYSCPQLVEMGVFD